MVYDAERDKRDLATRAFHDERVAAGEQRILARGQDAELHSYTEEEYGVLRAGPGPVMTTLRGHFIFVGCLLAGFVLFTYLIAAAYFGPNANPPWGMWFIPLLWLAIAAYAAHNLRIEWRAHKLRKARGLPTPTDRTVYQGPGASPTPSS